MTHIKLILAALAAALMLTLPVSAAAESFSGPEPINPIQYGPEAADTLAVFPVLYSSPTAAKAGTVTTQPASDKTIVFVHGGWWSVQPGVAPIMDVAQMDRMQLEAGGLTLDVDYPQETWAKPAYPMQYQAIVSAVLWAHAHAAEYGGDPNNIELIGASAGGQIVQLAAEHLATEDPGLLKAVVSLSAPALNFVTWIHELITGETYVSGEGPTVQYLQCHAVNSYASCDTTPAEIEREIERSPIDHIPSAALCTPEWISWGEEADFVDKQQSIEYAGALESAGCQVRRAPAPRGHAIDYFPAIRNELFAWMNQH
jgi:acetyl esterase/lipase